jgi:lipoyl(octanoyl) transferase
MASRLMEVIHLGKMSYKESLKVQERYAKDLLESLVLYKQDYASWVPTLQKLLLVEHSPVYTIGQRQKNHSKAEVVKLQKIGADFHETNRGGLITYHGPGQLVVYPIIYMKYFDIGMKR